ncbi:MAG: DUF1064 domain-containing protein [Clostridiales bacterium]|nr:DUF1064 domain-containing protein [Clostridiales bacterium]
MGQGESRPAEDKQPPKRSKYGNKRTELDGQVFDSRHEAQVYEELRLRYLAGELRGILRQMPFLLPGGVRYVADFVILNNDGTYSVLDAKSEATSRDKTYRIKKRQMRECLGIEVQEV